MKISGSTYSWVAVATLTTTTTTLTCHAFCPPHPQYAPPSRTLSSSSSLVTTTTTTSPLAVSPPSFRFRPRSSSSRLHLSSSDDFSENKYTEAAWAAIASLTKAADYYQASTVEAVILLDVLLNPAKHGAGEAAQSAQRVVETTLAKTGLDLKVLRASLETYLSKQPKVQGSAQQKTMARSLQKVLETARDGKTVLGVSVVVVFLFWW